MRAKRMWGQKIDPDFNRFHYLIWNYTFYRMNCWLPAGERLFARNDLELLVALVHENRGITVQDIVDFPMGFSALKARNFIFRLVRLGLASRFEGHGSRSGRGTVYQLSYQVRKWVSDMDGMQLGCMKIPETCACRRGGFSGERKCREMLQINWLPSIKKFNAWVDEITSQYKIIKNQLS